MSRRLLVLPILLAAAPACAQDRAPDPAEAAGGDHIIVGAAATILPDYEGSDDYRWAPAPGALGRIGGIDFQIVGNRASVDLIADGGGEGGWNFQLGPVGAVNFNRSSLKAIDDPQVRALGKLGTAIELGGYVGIGKTGVLTSPYDRVSLTLSYRHDVAGVHDSGIWTPSVSYITPLSRKALAAVSFSADRVGEDYADTYFGVTPAGAAASGLSAYDPDGGWKNWTLAAGGGVSLTGDLTHGLMLVAGGAYRRLLGDFAASPLTRARGQWIGMAGLAFSF